MICMVDVVQEFDARGVDRGGDFHAEPGAIALVVRVIDLTVQQFDAHGYAVLFSRGLETVPAGDAFSLANVSRRDIRDACGEAAPEIRDAELLRPAFDIGPIERRVDRNDPSGV